MYIILSNWGGSAPLVIWIITLIVGFTCAVVQIHSLCYFKSLQRILAISKRYPRLVLAEAICVAIMLIFGLPFVSNASFGAVRFGLSAENYELFQTYQLVIYVPLLHFAWIAEVTRLWLISFNLHYLHSSQNKKWKSQIDKSFAKDDWYINHRNTFGNQKWMATRAFLFYLCITASVMSAHIICYPIKLFFAAAAFEASIGCFYMFSVFFMYYQCRDYKKLQDNLYFHYEIKTTCVIWFVSLCLYASLQIMYLICYYYEANYYLSMIAGILVVIVSILSSLGPSLLSTLWIPRKIRLDDIWDKSPEFVQSQTSFSEFVQTESGLTNALNETIQCEEKFEQFIQWMYREFSSEAGLCFIEMVQFKQALMKFISNTADDDKGGKTTQEFDTRYVDLLYNAVPRSSIVFKKNEQSDGMARFQQIAHELFEKYIKLDAEFEINISHSLRAKYTRLDEKNWKMKPEEFVHVFEKIVVEMYFFQMQSFARYQTQNVVAQTPSSCSSVMTINE